MRHDFRHAQRVAVPDPGIDVLRQPLQALTRAADGNDRNPRTRRLWNQINIASQFLQTNEKIGYVVTDIDAASSDLALEKLAQVPGTIRSRVLF